MHATTEADLSPAERLREIAAILAAGILRLHTRPESMPEPAPDGPGSSPEKSSDSARN